MSGSRNKIPNRNRASAPADRKETENRPESTRSRLTRFGADVFKNAFPLLSTLVNGIATNNKDGAYERAQENSIRERAAHHSEAMAASLTNLTIDQGQSVVLLKELLSVVKDLKSPNNQNQNSGDNQRSNLAAGATNAAVTSATNAAGSYVANNILNNIEQSTGNESENASPQANNTVTAPPPTTPRISGGNTPRISASTTPEPAASRVNQEAIERFTPQAEREVDRALQKYNFTSEQYQNYDQFRENLVRSTARDIPRTGNSFREIREAQIDSAVLREVTRHARQTGDFANMMIANQPVYRNRPLSESQVSTMTTSIGMGNQYPEWLTRRYSEQREQARQAPTASGTQSTTPQSIPSGTGLAPATSERNQSSTPPAAAGQTAVAGETTTSATSSTGLVTPTSGRVTSPFGMRSMGDHKGIDYGVPEGTPIIAAHGGTIAEARESPSYGNMIRIHGDNGIDTLYAHLSSFGVQQGQQVTAGQQIALSGNTGRSTDPHLHFEAIRNGTKIDPAPLLGLSRSQSTQFAESQTPEPASTSSDASPVASAATTSIAAPAQMMATASTGAAVAGASQANAMAERTPAAPSVVSPDSVPAGQATAGAASAGTFSSPNDPGNVEPADSADRYAKLFNMAA
jgi:murein DD-endopeptidase MepM/ murein hydrolase activator NlpD